MDLPRIERKLAAILAADVAGYSRLMGVDEEGTLAQLRAHRRALVDPKIKEHRGRIVKTTGDGVLVEFASVVDAVRYAVEVQRGMAERNAGVPQGKRIEFRIGINLGDIIVQDKDIFGDGVNVAARLEALAEPGGICVSRAACDQVRDKLVFTFEDIGEQALKNIARPVHAYRVRFEGVEHTAPRPRTAAPRRLRLTMWAGTCMVLLVSIAGVAWYATRRAIPLGASRLSIVVLPFANVSNDSEQDYFADGITDDLTTDLSRVSGSFVIARTTAFTYKGRAVDVKQIGRELGVRYVLEGSVRRTREQVQINAQLIDAETGAHIWADRFDGDRRVLTELQNDVISRIFLTLNRELIGAVGRRIEQEHPTDPDARDFMMRGRAAFYRLPSRENSQSARGFFEHALAIDARSSAAMIGLANVLVSDVLDGWSNSPDVDRAHAEILIRQALDIDPNSADAHLAKGKLLRSINRLEDAFNAFQTAIALDRNSTGALVQIGIVLTLLGQPEEAIPSIEKSVHLNPRAPSLATSLWALGYAHVLLGHIDEAINLLKRARTQNPGLFYVHFALAGAMGFKGDIDEAKLELAEAIRLKPEYSTLKRIVAGVPDLTNPKYWALREKTMNIGLRNAGLPDE